MLNISILFLILVLMPIGQGAFLEFFRNGKGRAPLWLWTRGLVLEWLLFAVIFVVFKNLFEYSFHAHWISFLILAGILSLAGVVLVFIGRRKIISLEFFQKGVHLEELCLRAAVIVIVVFLCWRNVNQSIFLSDDITIETMNTVLQNNTVGELDPYTGLEYSDTQEVYQEPALTIFWTGLSWSLGIHPAELLNTYLAPFFILLFYALCLEAGRQLFGVTGGKAEWFVLCIVLLHMFGAARNWLPFYQLENGPWISAHVLSWFLLPMLALELFKWLQSKKKIHQSIQCILIGAAVVLLADAGWFYVLVMAGLAGLVYGGRKLWKC